MRYPLIRRTAYMPDRDHAGWQPDFHLLSFDPELGETLGRFYKTCRPRAADYGLPVRSLNGLLHTAAPGVLAIGRGATADESIPWLYAHQPVPPEVVLALLNTWVMRWVPKDRKLELEEELECTLGAIGDCPFVWTTEPVDLTAASWSAGGSEIPERRLYSLLPEQIAFRVARDAFGEGSRRLAFRVVNTDQGAEAVSWPPLRYTTKGHEWRYSVCLKITTQSVPFGAPFRVHVTSGIRRWVTKSPVTLRGRSATVLLDVASPWEHTAERQRLVRNAVAYDKNLGAAAWTASSPAGLLPVFDLLHSYPEAEQLLQDPAKWIAGHGAISAGIVYSNGLGDHAVGTGLMPVERRELDEWVESLMPPGFRRVPDLVPAGRMSKPELARKPSDDDREVYLRRVAHRRETLKAALSGTPLDVEVLWQSERTLERLVSTLRELLDLPPARRGEDGALEWDEAELSIRIRGQAAGSLVEGMKLPDQGTGSRSQRLAQVIGERREKVRQEIGAAEGHRGAALVEIRSAAHFAKDTDPKFAVRLGLADVGKVSQFLVIEEDTKTSLETRAKWIWLDLFRQLGAVYLPVHRAGTRIPKDLQYVGVWLVSRRSGGPTRHPGERLVAVRVRPGERFPVQVWDRSRNDWLPYPDFLIRLAQGVDVEAGWEAEADEAEPAEQADPFGIGRGKADVERDLKAVLFRTRDRPTLMLLNSGNIRLTCLGLGNSALIRDMLAFKDTPPQRITALGADLRLLLVRDHSGREESPQWYAPNPDRESDSAGFSAGLWLARDAGAANRVFASTTDYPKTAEKLPRGLRKLFADKDKRIAPSKNAWNPRMLELTVLGCVTAADLALSGRDDIEPDVAEDYALLAHQMRFHDDYEPLGHPLPQHWAMKTIEYLLPLANSPDSNGDD